MTGFDAPAPANPFVGPRPIENGQPIFGRDLEIDQLYYLLSAERIVLFHSPSGAGKSSLLQAGLIPRLASRFDVWSPVRVNLQPKPDAPENTNRYVRSCILGFETAIPVELQRPEEIIASMTLSEYIKGRPRRRLASENVVLIFDQFEEVLTVDPLALDAKREFLTQLGRLLLDTRIWAIFALREDYLAPLDPYAELLPTYFRNRFRLDLLRRNAAAEAIRLPVERAGRQFAPQALAKLVSDLAMMQVQQAGGEFKSEAGPYIEPLHLQVACRSLWERLAPDRTVIEETDIESFGDVTRALADYYEAEVARAAAGDPRKQRSIREWCGGMLITRGNIRGQVLRERAQSGGLDNSLIDRLIDAHLVRGEQRVGATWYELAHDRLVEPILHSNEHWFEAHLSKVQQRAQQWERGGEPESLLVTGTELAAARRSTEGLTAGERRFLAASLKKHRRLLQIRAAAVVLFAFLIVTSALGVIARRERDRAEMNLRLATQAVDESLSSIGRRQARESADSPEMEAFRKSLLDKAAAFYAVFTHEDSGNTKLRAEAAWAHSRLGDVNRLLERRDEAVREYKLARSGFQALATQYPKATEYRKALAYCHNWLGETLRMELEQSQAPNAAMRTEAMQDYDEALRLQAQIHTNDPADADDAQSLARSFYNRGILLSDGGDRQGSESDFRSAIALLGPIADRPRADDSNQFSPQPAQELARVYNNLAALEERRGRSGEAKELYEQAIQRAEQLIASNPQEREYQVELAQYSQNEARLLLVDLHDPDAAAHRNHEALDIVEALANPAPALSVEQAKIFQLRSEILLAQGSPDARAESDRVLELLDRMGRGQAFQLDPLFHAMCANLAMNYVELATRELNSGDIQDAKLSLNSLAQVLPQLTQDEKEAALVSYNELEKKLQSVRLRHN
jgi:tetratricopeptide (TPR) repeat protein